MPRSDARVGGVPFDVGVADERHDPAAPAIEPALSVVVPAYNEQDRIGPTLSAIAAHMDARGGGWELIVSDDGSTDATCETVRGLGIPGLRLVEAERNLGKGAAVRRGIAAAKGTHILFADADLATPIGHLEPLFRAMNEHAADIAIGSRAVTGAVVAGKSTGRRLLSAGLRQVVRLGFRLPYRDTQCGFKLFTAAAAHQLFAVQRIDGFSFDLEILFIADRLGLRVVEVPVAWSDSPGSTVAGGRDTFRFLADLPRIRWNDARGRYRCQVPGPEARALP